MAKRLLIHKKKLITSFFTLNLLLDLLLVLFIAQASGYVTQGKNFEQAQKKYPLLSKRILQEFPQDILINFLDLRKTLKAQVAPYGDTFGFYFEYLPTGTSIGVNEKNEFHAASLFKIPVIMAYYHFKERMGLVSDPDVVIKQEEIDQEFGDLWRMGAGHKINLSDAVKLAIIDSDNTAAKIVADAIDEEDFAPVYNGLDIDLQSDNTGAILTAKSYTSVLKSLYFAAVLNKNDSQYILDLLGKTKFLDKLAAGVPPDIKVSHKIGDYIDPDGKKAFMDCGIIYLPRRPYSVCMISISDEQTAKERMRLLSKTIYNYISKVE